MQASLAQFQKLTETIRGKIHPSLKWEWDSRFHVVLLVLTVPQSKDIYGMLKAEFAENWVSESIKQAPQMVQQLADQVLGIRHGQLLFTMNPSDKVVFFAAWWPWDDGENISLRIGLRPVEGSPHAMDELEKVLRGWFGV